jgi:hypothetical protein
VAFVLSASAHAGERVSYTVTVVEPRQTLIWERDQLVRMCGRHTQGCTHIMGATLAAECVPEEGVWRMRPFVSFIPYVYIGTTIMSRLSQIHTHEMTHISDVERSIENHARGIARTRFTSFQQCRDGVSFERERIVDVTRSFANRSLELRQ